MLQHQPQMCHCRLYRKTNNRPGGEAGGCSQSGYGEGVQQHKSEVLKIVELLDKESIEKTQVFCGCQSKIYSEYQISM